MDDKTQKDFFSKLIRPIHISYIQNYILRTTMEETIDIIKKYMEEGVIEESKYGKDYYVLKNK